MICKIRINESSNFKSYIFVFDKYLYAENRDYPKLVNLCKRALALRSVNNPPVEKIIENNYKDSLKRESLNNFKNSFDKLNRTVIERNEIN